MGSRVLSQWGHNCVRIHTKSEDATFVQYTVDFRCHVQCSVMYAAVHVSIRTLYRRMLIHRLCEQYDLCTLHRILFSWNVISTPTYIRGI